MSKKEEMLGVIFDNTEEGHPVIDSDNSMYYIPFDKTEEYFDVYENLVTFIKACESQVRRHPFYKKYIKYLREVVGLDTCQVFPNIEMDDNVTIEMHHGPILTLFDTCMIVVNHLRKNGYKDITTFKVANIVIEEHRLNNVRVLFLAKTAHQKVHDDDVMLNYQMGFGDTKTFLAKYCDGVDAPMAKSINAYIEWSKNNDSFDNDVFEISEKLREWGNNDYEDML